MELGISLGTQCTAVLCMASAQTGQGLKRRHCHQFVPEGSLRAFGAPP